jgi:septum formation protein
VSKCGQAKGEHKASPLWVLASASPRRHEILVRLGMRFHVDPAGIAEPVRKPGEMPSRYAIRVARLKAKEAAKKHGSGLILSADTIVVLGNRILTKPESQAAAQCMLEQLSGRWHEVVTGVCLRDAAQRRGWSTSTRTRVHFRRLSPAEIEWYLNTGEYRDKAGAYGVQGYASLFIDRIEGCYFNVVGFPIAAFEKLCRKSGIDLLNTLIRHQEYRIGTTPIAAFPGAV